MQKELEAEYPDFDFQLLGVNKFGKEAGNDQAADGRDIPLLQDVDADGDGRSDVWTQWNVDWRDVVIVDATGTKVGTYNLTKHDLGEPENYNTLRQMLVDAANLGPPKPPPLTGLDLLAVSDSGIDSTDNLTNRNNESVDRTLQIQVSGAVEGATVYLWADGVEIGRAGASSDTLVVTTDGTVKLEDGPTYITATQRVDGRTSDPSDPLQVIIDTVVSPFSSAPPSIATVGTLYSYDAENDESGLRYRLDSAPSGASIDATDGLLNWTPTAEQTGTHRLVITAADAAGNRRSQTVDVTVAAPDEQPVDGQPVDEQPVDEQPGDDRNGGDQAGDSSGLSSLSGFVYIDVDNDGVFEPSEQPICRVQITLEGTTDLGQTVRATRITGVDGSYSFGDLEPGRYRVREQQPEFLIDGKETLGSIGGDRPADDQFEVVLGPNVRGIDYNFGERGRPSHFIGVADFFASTPRQGVLAAIATDGGERWHSGNGDWLEHKSMHVGWSADHRAVELSGVDPHEQAFAATIALDDASRIRLLEDRGDIQLVRIHGAMASGRSRGPGTVGGTGSGTGGAEGESRQDFSSVVTTGPSFLLLSSRPVSRDNSTNETDAIDAVRSFAGSAPQDRPAGVPVNVPAGSGFRDSGPVNSSDDSDNRELDDRAVDLLVADDLWLDDPSLLVSSGVRSPIP